MERQMTRTAYTFVSGSGKTILFHYEAVPVAISTPLFHFLFVFVGGLLGRQ